jgi:transcriptional regulator with XRE-family HTH domain
MGKNRRAFPACLADKLLAIRLSLNLSQTEMLKEIRPELDDSLRSSISKFELGVRSPSLLEALAYARLAKVSVEQLIDDRLDLPKEIMAKSEPPERAVRDTFTMPKADYELISAIRERLLQNSLSFSKSEVLRGGIAILSKMPDAELVLIMNMVERIKIGRR